MATTGSYLVCNHLVPNHFRNHSLFSSPCSDDRNSGLLDCALVDLSLIQSNAGHVFTNTVNRNI